MTDHRHERFMSALTERLAASEQGDSFGVETADFGTVAGQHTAAELQDLINSKDHDLAEFDRIQKEFIPQWKAKDLPAATDWSKDWDALQGRYNTAHVKAKAAIVTANAPAVNPIIGLAATESAWSSVLKSLKQAGDPGPITKGDLQDLASRLGKAGADLKFSSPTPQPTATDTDLKTLNALSSADVLGAATGDTTAHNAFGSALGVVFGTNLHPTPQDQVNSMKFKVGIGVLVGAIALYAGFRVWEVSVQARGLKR